MRVQHHVIRRLAFAATLTVVCASIAGAQRVPRTWTSDVANAKASHNAASSRDAHSADGVRSSAGARSSHGAHSSRLSASSRAGALPNVNGTARTPPQPVNLPATLLQDTRNRRWEGAVVGFVAGATSTYLVLYSGGSTSLCDRDANQDAIDAQYCVGLTALGGVAGGAAGYAIGGRIRR